jgi:hypothetical protein
MVEIVGFGKLQSKALLSRTIASNKNVLPSCEVYRCQVEFQLPRKIIERFVACHRNLQELTVTASQEAVL